MKTKFSFCAVLRYNSVNINHMLLITNLRKMLMLRNFDGWLYLFTLNLRISSLNRPLPSYSSMFSLIAAVQHIHAVPITVKCQNNKSPRRLSKIVVYQQIVNHSSFIVSFASNLLLCCLMLYSSGANRLPHLLNTNCLFITPKRIRTAFMHMYYTPVPVSATIHAGLITV